MKKILNFIKKVLKGVGTLAGLLILAAAGLIVKFAKFLIKWTIVAIIFKLVWGF